MGVVPHNDCMCDGCMIKYYRQGLIHKNTHAYDEVMKILKNRKTKIVSGFPAVGKSVLTKNSHYKVLDSDSSQFSWIKEGERHPDFPDNYMNHIKKNIGEVDYILVSSHDVVRQALEENNIEYNLIYPSIDLKEEYIKRFKSRGNDENFIKFIDSKWNDFINNIENETFPILLRLDSGEYLSDVLHLVD